MPTKQKPEHPHHLVTPRLPSATLHIALYHGDQRPGLNLHPLKGERQRTWAVQVSGNWRVTFRRVGPDVSDVHYEDYH
jgi:proteic killer suppression protein